MINLWSNCVIKPVRVCESLETRLLSCSGWNESTVESSMVKFKKLVKSVVGTFFLQKRTHNKCVSIWNNSSSSIF